jgi:hypothetical protein
MSKNKSKYPVGLVEFEEPRTPFDYTHDLQKAVELSRPKEIKKVTWTTKFIALHTWDGCAWGVLEINLGKYKFSVVDIRTMKIQTFHSTLESAKAKIHKARERKLI